MSALARDRLLQRFAWCVLAYNILVVLWGAYVRATGSGAGCGSHWPLCNGEAVPRAPKLETIIEFTHRVSSGLSIILVGALCIWVFRRFPRASRIRRTAVFAAVTLVLEALLGAGLVLLSYVAQNASAGRAVYLSAHLINTQLLLSMLAATAWLAGNPRASWGWRPGILVGALAGALIAGVTGALAALGDTLFPATSLAAGIREELTGTAPLLLR
jgi:cytochrome c oxidase assembly protein subunit 15